MRERDGDAARDHQAHPTLPRVQRRRLQLPVPRCGGVLPYALPRRSHVRATRRIQGARADILLPDHRRAPDERHGRQVRARASGGCGKQRGGSHRGRRHRHRHPPRRQPLPRFGPPALPTRRLRPHRAAHRRLSSRATRPRGPRAPQPHRPPRPDRRTPPRHNVLRPAMDIPGPRRSVRGHGGGGSRRTRTRTANALPRRVLQRRKGTRRRRGGARREESSGRRMAPRADAQTHRVVGRRAVFVRGRRARHAHRRGDRRRSREM